MWYPHALSLHQIGLGDGGPSMVNDFNAVALALTEDDEFPPGP